MDRYGASSVQSQQRFGGRTGATGFGTQQSAAAATSTSGTAIQHAAQTLDVLHEMSKLLNTGLTRDQLMICVTLCEAGVNPEALAAVIKELKREAQAIQQQ
jgi:mitotic-spindle organizing protein 1